MEKLYYHTELLDLSPKFTIKKYDNIQNIKDTHSSFEGTPKQHPTDENIIILLPDPFDSKGFFYEFFIDSVGTVEDIGTIISDHGETAHKIRIWIKKGKTAIKSQPFKVE